MNGWPRRHHRRPRRTRRLRPIVDLGVGTTRRRSHNRAIQAYLDAGSNDFGKGGVHNRTAWIELMLDEVRAQADGASEFAALCREWDQNGDRNGLLDGSLTAAERLRLESMISGWESGFEFGNMRQRAALRLTALREALDSGDVAAIEAALSNFAIYADNDEFAKDLVRVLGPEGVVDLYDDINLAIQTRHLDFESLWDNGLKDFNDAIALGRVSPMGGVLGC